MAGLGLLLRCMRSAAQVGFLGNQRVVPSPWSPLAAGWLDRQRRSVGQARPPLMQAGLGQASAWQEAFMISPARLPTCLPACASLGAVEPEATPPPPRGWTARASRAANGLANKHVFPRQAGGRAWLSPSSCHSPRPVPGAGNKRVRDRPG